MTEQQEVIVYTYYYYTIKDIASGVDLDVINGFLKMYEEAELYEHCIGIKQGIEYANIATVLELKNEIEEIEKDLTYEIEEY